MPDWKKVKAEYIRGGVSYRKLAEKYGVSFSTLRKVASKEKWTDLRNKAGAKRDSKIVESVASQEARRVDRLNSIADKLLDKIEKSIEELDLHIATETHKTKIIEYNNIGRPDKPTKEVIDEIVEVKSYQSIIDKSGLKQIASAIRDLKEVQMIKSALDQQEQMARIDKLRKEAQSDKESNDIRVVIEGLLDDYAT